MATTRTGSATAGWGAGAGTGLGDGSGSTSLGFASGSGGGCGLPSGAGELASGVVDCKNLGLTAATPDEKPAEGQDESSVHASAPRGLPFYSAPSFAVGSWCFHIRSEYSPKRHTY